MLRKEPSHLLLIGDAAMVFVLLFDVPNDAINS
jgi:hypothetical protein